MKVVSAFIACFHSVLRASGGNSSKRGEFFHTPTFPHSRMTRISSDSSGSFYQDQGLLHDPWSECSNVLRSSFGDGAPPPGKLGALPLAGFRSLERSTSQMPIEARSRQK